MCRISCGGEAMKSDNCNTITTHTLMEYLQLFPPESVPAMAVIDRKRRIKYPVRETIRITDGDCPVIVFDVGEPEDLDGEDETP